VPRRPRPSIHSRSQGIRCDALAVSALHLQRHPLLEQLVLLSRLYIVYVKAAFKGSFELFARNGAHNHHEHSS
jgi:hypothetical protein